MNQVPKFSIITKTSTSLQADSLQPSKEDRFPLPVARARRQERQEHPRLHRLPGKSTIIYAPIE